MLWRCCCGSFISLNYSKTISPRVVSALFVPLLIPFHLVHLKLAKFMFLYTHDILDTNYNKLRTIVRGFFITVLIIIVVCNLKQRCRLEITYARPEQSLLLLHPIHWWGRNLHNNGFVRKKCTSKCLLSDIYHLFFTMAIPTRAIQ